MGYCLNCLDEPVFMAGPKLMLTEFGIHHKLESCVSVTLDLRDVCWNFMTLLQTFIQTGNRNVHFRVDKTSNAQSESL